MEAVRDGRRKGPPAARGSLAPMTPEPSDAAAGDPAGSGEQPVLDPAAELAALAAGLGRLARGELRRGRRRIADGAGAPGLTPAAPPGGPKAPSGSPGAASGAATPAAAPAPPTRQRAQAAPDLAARVLLCVHVHVRIAALNCSDQVIHRGPQ